MYWILLLLLVPVAMFGVWLSIRHWRGETHISDRAPPWWVWGDDLWRGARRAVPVFAAAVVLSEAAFIAALLFEIRENRVLGYSLVAAASAWLLTFLTGWSIILFNVPKRLVPPGFREERGMIQSSLTTR